ncbi:MAG: MMPL family transporter [Thermodesulfobacteriota bacterium]
MEERPGTRGLIVAFIESWVEAVRAHAVWVVIASVLATGGLFYYTAVNLGVSTDTAGMISPHLKWRQDYLAYKEAFPQFFGEVAIVVDGATPEIADRAAEALAGRLEAETGEGGTLKTVYAPGGGEFFKRNGLLYLDVEELEDLADNLARVQPFIGTLVRDQSLVGLFSMVDKAMEAASGDEEVDLTGIFDEMAGAFDAAAQGRFYSVSWRGLMGGPGAGSGVHRRFVVVQPSVDFSGIQGEEAIRRIRETVRELGLDGGHGVRVRLTGSVAVANEELKSVSRGAGVAGAAAFVLVTAILIAGLRSVRLVAAAMYTLAAGLVATAAFAAWAIGTLNLISVAFAVLYIGLGIDYAIHITMRYRELLGRGLPQGEALTAAAGDVGSSIVVCAVTTSAAFFAFVPTAYAGVSELGIIAGTGMIISLLFNLTVLPAVLSLFPVRVTTPAPSSGGWRRAADFPVRHRAVVWTATGLVVAASVALVPKVRFSYDPMALRGPETESVSTYYDLMKDPDTRPLTISVLKDGPDRARAAAARLKGLKSVDKALTLFDFIPGGQDEKLALIEEMALLLGPELESGPSGPPHALAEKVRSIEGLTGGLGEFIARASGGEALSARRLRAAAKRFQERLSGAGRDRRERLVERLEASLIEGVPALVEDLRRSLEADYVGMEDLPEDLVGRWISPGGKFRVEVFPARDLSDDEELKRFVGEVTGVERRATGAPVFMVEAGRSVIKAFTQAFIYSFVLIVIILVVLMPRPRDSLVVLLPLLMAGLITAAGTVVFGIPFNFANTIALPLILGIGVDNGVHIVSRARAGGLAREGILATSTARAVLLSAFTTVASFGGLGFSPHPGTASIGHLLAVGIILSLATTLVFLPTLLVAAEKKKKTDP